MTARGKSKEKSVSGNRCVLSPPRKIGIIGKSHHPQIRPVVEHLLERFRSRGVEAVVDRRTTTWRPIQARQTANILTAAVDLIVVLGGDGTLLSVARLAQAKGIPLLGVNLGSLGFLTETALDRLDTVLERLWEGHCLVDERIMLEVQVKRGRRTYGPYLVLNDAVINKAALARMIEMEATVNGVYLTTYRADGLIVATPTGSTAYSLAAGGPIIYPDMEAVVITPICPHTLTNRSLVVPDRVVVEVRIQSMEQDIHLTLDGQSGLELSLKDRVIIRKAASRTRLVQCPDQDFFGVLRQKLKWGER